MKKFCLFCVFFISYVISMEIVFASAIKKVDPKRPIKIEADEVKIKRDNNQVFFVGKVKIKQDELSMFADNMVIDYYKNKDGDALIKDIRANDNVILKNKTITAKGDNAVYDFDGQVVVLKDNVILNEEDAVVLGDVLTYNVETQETKMGTKDDEENINNMETIEKIEENAEENKKKNNKRVIIILDNINDIKGRYDK